MQRWGFKYPTRAANNPGRCDEIDETLHNWASRGLPEDFGFIDAAGKGILDSRLRGNDKGGDGKIDTIIAGHTHRPVFENLSLTERMCLEGRLGNMARGRNVAGGRKCGDTIPNSIEFRSCPRIFSDRAYYNTGSCAHPRCITGLEITPGKRGEACLHPHQVGGLCIPRRGADTGYRKTSTGCLRTK